MIQDIFKRIDHHEPLSGEDAVALLSIPNFSPDYYKLLEKANAVSREVFQGRGYVFAQIGLNSAPCSGGCKFCSLAQCNHTVADLVDKPLEEVLALVDQIDFTRVTALFLMTTADYDPQRLLDFGSAVRGRIPPETALVANTGDFGEAYARSLKAAGFTGAYHIVRLREGTDTDLDPAQRVRTLDAIVAAGLRLYYCLEPIGPEHTYEELAREMLRARDYHVDMMAAMRRVNVPGTAFADTGMISDFEMAKIVAVTRLVTMPKVSMNVHEPLAVAMLSGVNQLYAEIGVNPRDNSVETEKNRGRSVEGVCEQLLSAGYTACIEDRA